MKVEIIANGTITFALIPETDMDKIAIKMLVKQDNEFVEIRQQTQILNKASFTEGLVIQPKQRKEEIKTFVDEVTEEFNPNGVVGNIQINEPLHKFH